MIQATIRFPREGIWELTGYMGGEGWVYPEKDELRLWVKPDKAGIYTGTDETPEWMNDYHPPQCTQKIEEAHPISAQIDLSKAPRVQEEAKLEWSFNSIRDVSQAEARLVFVRYDLQSNEGERVNLEKVYIDGDTSWKGNIVQNAPVRLSTTVAFPEEGDWRVSIFVSSSEIHSGASGSVFLSVSEEEGRWGWAFPHQKVQFDTIEEIFGKGDR